MFDSQKVNSDSSLAWTGDRIRKTFLNFFADRDHQIIPSASLIPEDPTVLLTIAGMLPFKPIFLGQAPPPSPRATTSQKCIRTNDIENVGKTARHHTFFEMLGNFSFGDYFKKEAIQWSWELSTVVFGLDPNHLIISVFREDEEAETIWREEIGVDPKRIVRMDETDNFWSSGPTGPCGPCSELYYDFKPELGSANLDLEDGERFIEFYNLVFMQYNRDSNGKLTPLRNCNIDTGMGLERMAQILQKKSNNYETDLIFPLILTTAKLAGIDYTNIDEKRRTSLKVIADHSRAVAHLVADGVIANNLGRGYILRRLMRRMIRHGRMLGIVKPFLEILGAEAIKLMENIYPNLAEKKDLILSELRIEESRFLETLDRGERLLDDIMSTNPKEISGLQAFELYDTYGFPLELTQEIAEENSLSIDLKGFEKEMNIQKERAKAAAISIDLTCQQSIQKVATQLSDTIFTGYGELITTDLQVLAILVDGEQKEIASLGQNVQLILNKTPFYGESGGQIGDKGILYGEDSKVLVKSVTRLKNVFIHAGVVEEGSIKVNNLLKGSVDRECRRRAQSNHTATHLLQSALKIVVDSTVSQRGSLVAFDRLRFDFNNARPLQTNELCEIEKLINLWILEDHPIVVKSLPINEALEAGALAMFGEKYGDIVRVVDIPGVSMELCGGTHMNRTADLGLFKIISEAGVASGIRRVEAVAGPAVLDYLNERDLIVNQLTELFKAQPIEIVDRVHSLQNEVKEISRNLAIARADLAISKALLFTRDPITINNSQLIVKRLDEVDGSGLQSAAQELLSTLGADSAVVLGGLPHRDRKDKVVLVAAFSPEVIARGLQAGKFIGQIAKHCGGGGGGRPNLAQAGGKDGNSLDSALDIARQELINSLN